MSIGDIFDIPLDFLENLFKGGWLYVVIGVLCLIAAYVIWFA